MIFAVLVFIGLVSYNPEDYPNSGSPEVVTNWLGLAGAWISYHLYVYTIGYPCLVFPFIVFLFGWNLILRRGLKPFLRLSLYLLAIGVFISTALAMPQKFSPGAYDVDFNLSGMFGGFIADILFRYLGPAGSMVVLFAAFILLLLSATSWSMREALISFKDQIHMLFKGLKRSHPPKVRKEKRQKPVIVQEEPVKQDIPVQKPVSPEIPIQEPVRSQPVVKRDKPVILERPQKSAPEQKVPGEEKPIPENAGDTYQFPAIDILKSAEEKHLEIDKQALEERAYFLEEKLKEFDVRGEVVGVQPGPVITRFEVRPAPGVKISRFVGCQDDLSLAMKGQRVRVVAPIPGKAAVGIEIPNEEASVVSLRKMLESKAFQKSDAKLPLALGETIEGRPFIGDLTEMPHLLVAGATGAGKSVCLNVIIVSILYKADPTDVRMVLIDPKKLELSLYKKLRHHHLITKEGLNEEVVTTVDNAVAVLRSLEQEMERRYRILAHVGVRNIEDYNKVLKEKNLQNDNPSLTKLPYLVLIVDELADLMVTGAREVEEPIARLAQMSRAVGIHLILATQRPSVDVITGVIKANFPSRIAFQVAQKNDSRTILDRNGAEKLLGKGDMLYLHPREQGAIRIHGAFVSTDEVHEIVQHIYHQPRISDYKLKGSPEKSSDSRQGGVSGERDELFNEAAKLVIRHQQGSASLLQRRLRVGYARAGRLIDELEDAGIIGPFDGSKAREVLVEESYLEELEQAERKMKQDELEDF